MINSIAKLFIIQQFEFKEKVHKFWQKKNSSTSLVEINKYDSTYLHV